MDYLSLAKTLVSLLTSEKSDILSTAIKNLTGNSSIIENLVNLSKDGKTEKVTEIIKNISEKEPELLEKLQKTVEMVNNGEISVDNISDMVEKIGGKEISETFNKFKKFF